MRSDTWQKRYDVVVVGNGLAGCSAALFAAQKGLRVAVVGTGSQLPLSSGVFDLLGKAPGEEGIAMDPWKALEGLVASDEIHPYTKAGVEAVKSSFKAYADILNGESVACTATGENRKILTSVGTAKLTYLIPAAMENGVAAMEKKDKTLVVGLRGLKGFSALQVAKSAQRFWPEIEGVEIAPEGLGRPGDLYPESLARELDLPRYREILAEAVKPHLNGHKAVGFPSILGMETNAEGMAHLEELLGVPCFEIPGMPPTAAGVRLREAMDRAFSKHEVASFVGGRVKTIEMGEEGYAAVASLRGEETRICGDRLILATGRFMGGGLEGDRLRIKEPLLNLPVTQPESREEWHSCDLYDPKGHKLNLAGIEVDETMRPLNAEGKVISNTLFAVGSILAHQDWKREKSGAGISLATAMKAVESL